MSLKGLGRMAAIGLQRPWLVPYLGRMIRHVVVFRWLEGTTPEQIAALRAGLDGLPGAVPSILTYSYGPDLQLGEGRWDYAVVGDFADARGYQAYVDHPVHDAVRRDLIMPLVADRANVQIQL